MKEINGTVTLAYLEEDNKQRVIFRVIPLCTREGGALQGDTESFPDEGSMRVVPDKREQSTFKERMRTIGSLCAIYLVSDGKELMKVRPNRNYAPDQGERNQLAIYSDVICEFSQDGCFEVIEQGQSAQEALTDKVLIYKDKMLYGPVDKQSVESASVDALKPFGNEDYLLQNIEASVIGKRRIYWNPELTLNWRQRRNVMRRKDKDAEPATAEEEVVMIEESKPEPAQVSATAKPEPVTEAVKPEAPKPEMSKAEQRRAESRSRKQERAVKERQAAEERALSQPALPIGDKDTALPIGSRLEILDADMPFEQQIDRLAQPLSESANRLSSIPEEAPEEETDEVVAHFSGTPLVQPASRPTRSVGKPDTMHHVVEQQLRGQRDSVMGAEMGESAYEMVNNPIDTLQTCVDYIWQNAEMRKQALATLMENESFVSDVMRSLRQGGLSLQASAAAQEQLAEIEAERLSLLMQLETAKANESKFRQEAIAALSQKKREESERLKREVKDLKQTQQKLLDEARVLSAQNAAQLSEYIAQNMTCMTGIDEQRILLCPVLGSQYTQSELAEKLRVHMNDSGFSLNEDEAMSLLVSFSLFDSLCLRAPNIEDAQHFARVLLESFGLQSVSAVLMPGAYVEMISLLPEDARRAPTATVQPLGTETMSVYGHKTIFLTDTANLPAETDMMAGCPVINTPALTKRAFGYSDEWQPIAPASLGSFAEIRADSFPMLDEAEKWFAKLSQSLAERELTVPEASLQRMRRFIEIASRKVRGGFLAAADNAVAYWVVPMLLMRKADPDRLSDLLAGLPHTLNLLGIQ